MYLNLSTYGSHDYDITCTQYLVDGFPVWCLPPTCTEVTKLIYSSKTFGENFCSILYI